MKTIKTGDLDYELDSKTGLWCVYQWGIERALASFSSREQAVDYIVGHEAA